MHYANLTANVTSNYLFTYSSILSPNGQLISFLMACFNSLCIFSYIAANT